MRIWWIPTGILLLGGGTAVVTFLRSGQDLIVAPGPTYNGKTVSDWGNALQSSDVSDAASTNLTAIGKPAVPYLIKAAEWKPSNRDKLSSFIGRHGRGMWAYRLRCRGGDSERSRHVSRKPSPL